MIASLPHSPTFSRAGLVAALTLLLVLSHAPAQATPDAPGPTQGSSPPAASSGSVSNPEISFDLVVRTKHHQPVLNLDPRQVAITDGGTPVQLTSLRLVNADAGSQHLVTLVFDRLDPNAARTARMAAEKILGAIPEAGYTFAVLEVNGRLRLLQSWTKDRRAVDAAVAEATPIRPDLPSGDLTPAEQGLIASLHSDALTFTAADRKDGKLLLDALEQSQRILEERRAYPSLAAIQALAGSDRDLSGRNFIFYFASDTAWNSDARDIVRSIVGLASRAGVTIGVVNTNSFNPEMNSYMESSLASSFLGNTAGSGGATPFAGGAPDPSSGGLSLLNSLAARNVADYQFGDVDSTQSPLVALAFGTGGIYIGGTHEWKHQLRELHEDLSAWYQASWMPPIKDYDGQFRPVTLHPLRKGLVIRARSGYFAVPPAGSPEIRPFEVPLLNLLASGTLPTDVAFHAGVLHLGALPDGNAAELVVQVPVSQLAIRQDANTHISSVNAAIVAVIKNSRGDTLQRFGEEFPLHESPEMFRTNAGQMLTLERQFSAQPGEYTLEAAVLDRVGNKAGGERTTFTIEAPPLGLALSDIALVGSVEPAEDDTQTFFEPMRYRDGRVVPSLDAWLPETTKSLSLFFLVHPVAGSSQQPSLHMQIIRNGKAVAEIPMELEKVSGTGEALPYLATIRAKAFPPGDYQARAVIRQGDGTATSAVSFHVEGAAATVTQASPLTAEGPPPEINAQIVSSAAQGNSLFVISSPANPLPAPAAATIHAMIEGTRQRALAWSHTLENFFCLEVTNHFEDSTGEGTWKPKGTLVEMMKYVDHAESRTILELNGSPTNVEPDRLQFFHSTGEFGAMFHVVFDASEKAVFTWKRSAFLDGQPVQVFAFQVARANSSLDLIDRELHVQPVGFQGLVYVDPATNSVRRISIDADDIPRELLIRACSMSVDYSWISMENHDFLLPVRGAVSLQETGRRPVLNQFEFRNYRRFGSQVRILSNEEMKALMNKGSPN